MHTNDRIRENEKNDQSQGSRPPGSDVAITIDDVSMVFNMASEQLNSLKEYAIALGKRELRFKEFHALKNISLEVNKGDVFGILGTNGSGKSTLLKIIAGVLDPTSGNVRVNGQIAPLIELGAGFDAELTARENIYLNGSLLGYSKRLIDDHFHEIVEFAEIEDFLDIPIKNYSSGMVARIAFSIATVIVPEILLVDEVLSVGDFMFQKKCENRIRQLIDEHGVTVLIVSHSNDQIRRLCNKAIWIDKGLSKLSGDAEKVCGAYAALGGRTGSSEAKDLLFNSIIDAEDGNEYPELLQVVSGDAFKVSADLSRKASAHAGRIPSSAIIVSSASHINAIYANALARALDASILPMNTDSISAEVLQYLYETAPTKIIYIDCGMSGMRALDKLRELPFQTEIIDLSGTGDIVEYSLHILEYGKSKGAWSSDEAFIIDYDDEMLGLSLTPLLYAQSCPVLFINNSVDQTQMANALQAVRQSGISRFAVAGKAMDNEALEEAAAPFPTRTIGNVGTLSQTCNSIYEVYDQAIAPHSRSSLCITLASFSQWMNCVGIGRYACETESSLISLDQRDLDSIMHCLNYTKTNSDHLTSATLVEGSEGLEGLYISLINKTLCS